MDLGDELPGGDPRILPEDRARLLDRGNVEHDHAPYGRRPVDRSLEKGLPLVEELPQVAQVALLDRLDLALPEGLRRASAREERERRRRHLGLGALRRPGRRRDSEKEQECCCQQSTRHLSSFPLAAAAVNAASKRLASFSTGSSIRKSRRPPEPSCSASRSDRVVSPLGASSCPASARSSVPQASPSHRNCISPLRARFVSRPPRIRTSRIASASRDACSPSSGHTPIRERSSAA